MHTIENICSRHHNHHALQQRTMSIPLPFMLAKGKAQIVSEQCIRLFVNFHHRQSPSVSVKFWFLLIIMIFKWQFKELIYKTITIDIGPNLSLKDNLLYNCFSSTPQFSLAKKPTMLKIRSG